MEVLAGLKGLFKELNSLLFVIGKHQTRDVVAVEQVKPLNMFCCIVKMIRKKEAN